jgi:Flp pilus assembly protein TadD
MAMLWWQLGKVYQNNDQQEALQWLKNALNYLPEQENLQEDILNIYWIRANNAYQKRRYQDCISYLEEALDLKYDFTETVRYNIADIHYSLGNAYYALKDFPKAIYNYQHAIESDNGHFYAYGNLGNVYFAQQKFTNALEEYNQSINLEDGDAVMYYNRANTYEALHNYPASLADFAHTIALDATFARAYLNSGHVYAVKHRHVEAIAQYKQAYEIDPTDIQIAWIWHWATFTKTLIDEYDLQVLSEIAALDEQHYVAYLCRGISLWVKQRESATARRELELAQALEPEEWDAYFWQGIFSASLTQTKEAEELIDKALKLGLPPSLLTPLYWLEMSQPQFFRHYVKPLLTYHHW